MLMMLVTHFRPGSSFRFRAEVQGSRQPLHSAKTFHLVKKAFKFSNNNFFSSHPKVVLPKSSLREVRISMPLGDSEFPHV